jgi:hypothetical protein
VNLYLRDQTTILGDVEARLRDTANARYVDAEIYRAINDALLTWHGRVSVPNVHTISGGWVASTNEYTIPAYVNPATVIPQMKRTVPYSLWGQLASDISQQWTDIPGWTIEPDGSGGNVLKFDIPPYSTEGRLLWFGINGPVPATIPAVGTEQSAAATTLVLSSAVDCIDNGFVKCGSEWMQYSGVTRGASTTTLNNVLRAYDGGAVAAIHAVAATVAWGVAMPRLELYRTLLDQAMVFLHELYLSDASPKEIQVHQQMVSFYQARIDKFWRSWVPQRRARLVLDRRYATIE